MNISQQQRVYDALKRIARDYREASKILEKPYFGLDPVDCLEVAYENIQSEAKAALKGIRRPS